MLALAVVLLQHELCFRQLSIERLSEFRRLEPIGFFFVYVNREPKIPIGRCVCASVLLFFGGQYSKYSVHTG